jgi:hypothetical protein
MQNWFMAYKLLSRFFLPNMSPVMALTFWADKHSPVVLLCHFQWYQEVDVTFLAMIHIYDRISSPLHL